MLRDQLTLSGPLVLANRLIGAVYHRFFCGDWSPNTLGTCASSKTTVHVVHTWLGTVSFSPDCGTAREPDFRWTVNRMWRPSELACTTSLDFWLWGHLNTSVYSAPISSLGVLQQRVDNACQQIRMKSGIFQQRAHSCSTKSWKLCRNAWEPHTAPAVGTIYLSKQWFLAICWLGMFCSFRWVLYTLKAVSLSFNTLYTYFSSEVWLLVITQHNYCRMQQQIRSENTEIKSHRNGGYSMFNDHSSWNHNLVLVNPNTENQ
jgi:hypothetical protein